MIDAKRSRDGCEHPSYGISACRYHVGIASVLRRCFAPLLATTVMAGSAQAGAFDPFSFVMKRCIAPSAIGRDVDTSGMQRVPAAYRADWESDFASARAYAFPVGSVSSLPVPNPVLVVPREKNAPICRLTHKGLRDRDVRKLVKTFAKSPIVKEDVDLKTSADGVQTRGFVVTENAKSYVLLVVSIPFLKSNSVEVFTSRAFAGLGEN